MSRTGSTSLDDIRRQLRLGMGPCQGGFCIYRATGILHELDGLSAQAADSSLMAFLQERVEGGLAGSTATSCARLGSMTGSFTAS